MKSNKDLIAFLRKPRHYFGSDAMCDKARDFADELEKQEYCQCKNSREINLGGDGICIKCAKSVPTQEKMESNIWKITVPKGMTAEIAYRLCEKEFDCWEYTNSFKGVKEDRSAKSEGYDVYVKSNVEADEELKNKSANDIQSMGIKAITLTERLLLELQYFKKTGKHLDEVKFTLCAGSRGSDGSVPDACWGPDYREFYVDWSGVDRSHDDLRARQVASNPSDFNIVTSYESTFTDEEVTKLKALAKLLK